MEKGFLNGRDVAQESAKANIRLIEDVTLSLLSILTSNKHNILKSNDTRIIDRLDCYKDHKVIVSHFPTGSKNTNKFFLIMNMSDEEALNVKDMSNITTIYEVTTTSHSDSTYEINIRYGDKLIDGSLDVMLNEIKKCEDNYNNRLYQTALEFRGSRFFETGSSSRVLDPLEQQNKSKGTKETHNNKKELSKLQCTYGGGQRPHMSDGDQSQHIKETLVVLQKRMATYDKKLKRIRRTIRNMQNGIDLLCKTVGIRIPPVR